MILYFWFWSLIIANLYIKSVVQASILVIGSNETYADRAAAFGPRLSENGKVGYLVEPSSDRTGCNLVYPPISTDWIALVRRGGCSFVTKVRKMQESGAIAVVVGDPENRSGWVTMYTPDNTSDIKIPSLFITKKEYTTLHYLSKMAEDMPLMVILQADGFMTWPLLDLLLIIFVSPSIVMMFVLYSWLVKQKKMRRQEIASSEDIANLDKRCFRREKKSSAENVTGYDDEEECSICLESYRENDMLRVLPCKHAFHLSCVDTWLTTQKRFCPICKRDIALKSTIAAEITPLLSAR
ncbi:hypothetical protein BDF20DRAFT_289648 [Mycotypha africana]|uniref:uncharacterized protein n=1 Tax=Mycotypha africana TaxID=64632 RepID=UPI0023016A3F|nr:uncharacterized protein BDF20DRAFT_289648 [Mycotypha africana]KAI8987794.1 hypothetical protein BDF20DRAFT_289648 [Mycotypha africana]